MIDLHVAVSFGWPAIIVTPILAVMGLLKNHFRFLGGAASLPLSVSRLSGIVSFIRPPVIFPPIGLLSSAFSMYRDGHMLEWVLALSFSLLISLSFIAPIAQPVSADR